MLCVFMNVYIPTHVHTCACAHTLPILQLAFPPTFVVQSYLIPRNHPKYLPIPVPSSLGH